jgi:uncharacterized protein YjdB
MHAVTTGPRMRALTALAVAMIIWSGGCSGDTTGPIAVGSVTVTPADTTLSAIGDAVPLSAAVRNVYGGLIGDQPVSWTSSNPSVVAVTGSGVATAVSNGTATITAAVGGVAGTASVTVAQTVDRVAVTPATATLAALGVTQQLVAQAFDARNHPLAPQPAFTWSSSATGVATVSATGVVTAVANGSAAVTASTSGVSGTATITVAQAVAGIVLTPASVTLAAVGTTQQFAAEAFDANAMSLVTQPAFTWTSSQTAVATIDAGTGLATAVGNGTTTITASAGGVDGTAALTVSQAVASIVVTPSNATLSALGAVQQFTAEARDAGGLPLAPQPVITWTSSATGVATIDQSGRATAAGNGATTITASAHGVQGTATLTVSQSLASIVVSPANPTLSALGATQQFTAEARDASGQPLTTQPTFSWTSSQTSVATVGVTTGLATAIANGTTTITASAAGVDGTTTLTVTQAVASIVVSPTNPTLTALGATQTFTAQAFDGLNQALAAQPTFTWASSTPATATINPTTGVATAVANGTTTITASAAGVDGTHHAHRDAGGGEHRGESHESHADGPRGHAGLHGAGV